MIRLTRIKGDPFILNCDLIQYVEETPDTMITLVNGDRLLVAETADEVVRKVIEYGRLLRSDRPA